ncbi:MAG: addiction module protein [Sedimentisphaerales bacterium]|nr:addiction module protein [Sedimentisphaerales bacterium]
MHLKDAPEIEKLSVAEKILLVKEIWESITSEEPSVPVPESHRVELDRRLAEYEQHPGELLALEELQKRL